MVGQYVAVEISKAHYIAMILALVIAVLTTAEIIWQNVMERKGELLLLKAIGWRNGAIFRLIVWEGLLCGLIAAVCGISLGILVIAILYRQFPMEDIQLLLSTGAIPVIVGILGAIFPAVMAVRFRPAEGIRGSLKNRKRDERVLRVICAILILICMAGATTSVVRVWQAPGSQQESATEKMESGKSSPPSDEENKQEEDGGEKLGNLTGFVPQPVPDGSKATYDLSLHMKPNGTFVAEATIQVENLSADTWDSVVFYFLPNVFTKENKPDSIKGDADVRIINVELNQEQAKYQLTYDTLELPLENKMAPGQKKEVRVSYTFTVPEDGLRFDKMGQRYFLAQFYPMLATYQNGWNKHDYRVNGESYHTDHADFKLRYEVPPGYQVITTSDEDGAEAKLSGEVAVSKVRELYVAVVKGVDSLSQEVNGVQIRVFGEKANQKQLEAALQAASDALPFFSSKIGSYPHKQLDILVDGRVSMEYPGVVTAAAQENLASLRQTIVHEIAHQWFYGVVVNDSYQEGWLDEGFAELASLMFFMDHDKISEQNVWERTKAAAQLAKGKPSNLALDDYDGEIYGAFYAVPSLRMWELISTYGDVSDG